MWYIIIIYQNCLLYTSITFDDLNISNNIRRNTSFGGIIIKQWIAQGHDEVNLNGFHSDAVEATNELWHRRFDTATAENGYTNEGFHPHTNVYVTNNYVSNSKTEYGCNTIRLQSVEGGLVEHNVCAGAGTCALELDYLDAVSYTHLDVYKRQNMFRMRKTRWSSCESSMRARQSRARLYRSL